MTLVEAYVLGYNVGLEVMERVAAEWVRGIEVDVEDVVEGAWSKDILESLRGTG